MPTLNDQLESTSPGSLQEPSSMAQLLERISELEHENANLQKLDAAIRANNHRFEAILRASREAIMLISPALTVVRLIHSMLGYAERDVLGQSVLTFVHPEDAPNLEQ